MPRRAASRPTRSALDVALRYLNYRPRSVAEVKRRLRRQFSQEETEQAVSRLLELGLLDDAAFAQAWRNHRERSGPRSKSLMRLELAQKGVPSQLVRESVESVDDDEMAFKAATGYVRRLSGLDRDAFRRKLIGYLRRRGFGYRISAAVADRLWSELADAAVGDENGDDAVHDEKGDAE